MMERHALTGKRGGTNSAKGDVGVTERDTRSESYAAYLKIHAWRRRGLDVQLPYRLHTKALRLGRTLEIGCGAGRNLKNLPAGSVGIDHNAFAIELCREHRLEAYTIEEFPASQVVLESFDSLLLSHVIEHMAVIDALNLIRTYSPHLKMRGRIVIITPQEAGYRSDASHVHFFDAQDHQRLLADCGYRVLRAYSYPFPRKFGRIFRYNESITIGTLSARLQVTPT